ncbi:hypothetical protein, partial [Corallococcus exiguus]|uniref:hypothetical protein n=1 Tax=Corallococcus exiguus TaxID=83462 RepID=UPI001B8C9C75
MSLRLRLAQATLKSPLHPLRRDVCILAFRSCDLLRIDNADMDAKWNLWMPSGTCARLRWFMSKSSLIAEFFDRRRMHVAQS